MGKEEGVMAGRSIRYVPKSMANYTFRFKLGDKVRQKTFRAGDIYDAGQMLKKLYPKATNIRLS